MIAVTFCRLRQPNPDDATARVFRRIVLMPFLPYKYICARGVVVNIVNKVKVMNTLKTETTSSSIRLSINGRRCVS